MNVRTEELEGPLMEHFVRARALAFLKRGRSAGIPDRHLRINKESFVDMLFEEYHRGKLEETASFIYDSPMKLLEIPYIVIDGGDPYIRRRAGFALLFRLITCDRFGLYREAVDLAHKFRTPMALESEGRNDLIEQLKSLDVLFIAELQPRLFPVNFDTGTFFDEILVSRENNIKPTILSFVDPVGDSSKFTVDCGDCLHRMSRCLYADADKVTNPSRDLLRIRVKKEDGER